MRLRSRVISLESPLSQPSTPRRRRPDPSRAPRIEQSQSQPQTQSQSQPQDVQVLKDCSNLYCDAIPTAVKRPRLRHGRKRVLPLRECKESDFKTPVRHLRERHYSSVNPAAARSLYSPVVRFVTPTKDNERTRGGAVFSPEQCVFGYSAVSSLSEDEENDEVFSPFTFIKNIPNQSQQSRAVSPLRDIPPKTRSTPAATMVLDLDETLVFSSLNRIEDAEYTFNTIFQDQEYKVYVVLRPYVNEFLQAMVKHFEMFVYTSAKKEYAEMIVDILDPRKKIFRHRLYQDDCACVLGHYIKDLGVLERDLSKTVILDNAPHTFPYHLMNTIPIKSWCGDKEDKELQRLIPYLEKLAQANDFRTVLKRRTDHFHSLLTED
ncbi:CTD small phosphatase-like protein 2 isoform X2 [Pangasianodon hypophthalmus]|uniref:CTD small phosphatase-like protein 2 isoform X2 n=1 Tax=Pangasianodon hypophthalmus TaxID=310915 RepID=UPI002306FF5A|nr:CTD small phosphatase-like protein 2 isoform X2 [Pangasianodon hypophthalmus]